MRIRIINKDRYTRLPINQMYEYFSLFFSKSISIVNGAGFEHCVRHERDEHTGIMNLSYELVRLARTELWIILPNTIPQREK